MNIGITYLDYYIPESTIDIRDYFNSIKLPNFITNNYNSYEEFVEENVNNYECKKIPVELKKTPYEMYEYLINKYFQNKSDLKDIDLVIFTGQLLKYKGLNYSVPHRIIDNFNMNNAMVLEIYNYCLGIPSSIYTAKNIMLNDENIKKVMIVSNSFVDDMQKRYLSGTSILGDGAAILILEKTPYNIIKDYIYFNDGSFNSFMLNNSVGISSKSFMQYIDWGIKTIQKIIKKNKLEIKEIDQFLIQNTHKLIAHFYAKKLAININKIYLKNLQRYGHIGDIDFVLNLKNYMNEIEISPQVICQYYSAGITTNAILMVNVKNP
jgi:3-oxoacyl-[acyl-carrier-protein] synthase III